MKPVPTPEATLVRLAKRLGCSVDTLRVHAGRQAAHVDHRRAAIWALRTAYQGLTVQELGKLFGYRDHTTVLYHLRAVEDRRRIDAKYAHALDTLLPGRFRLVSVVAYEKA